MKILYFDSFEKIKSELNKYLIKDNLFFKINFSIEKHFNHLKNSNIKKGIDLLFLDLIYFYFNRNINKMNFDEYLKFLNEFNLKTLKDYLNSRNNVKSIYVVKNKKEIVDYIDFISRNIISKIYLENNLITEQKFKNLYCNYFNEKSRKKVEKTSIESIFLCKFNLSQCHIIGLKEQKNKYEVFFKKYNKENFNEKEYQDLFNYVTNLSSSINKENTFLDTRKNIIKIYK